MKPVFTCHHIVVQGVHGTDVFHLELNKQQYLDRVQCYRSELGISLYAYLFLENSAHFLFSGTKAEISGMMRRIGVSFAHWYRRTYHHEGTLFKGSPQYEEILGEQEVIRAAGYMYQKPVQEGLVEDVSSYPWSSYYLYALRDPDIQAKLDPLSEDLLKQVLQTEVSGKEDTPKGRFLEEKPAHFGYTDDEVRELIRARLMGRPLVEIHQLPSSLRNYILAQLRFLDNVSILQLARVSEVGRGIVQRLTREDLDLTLYSDDCIIHSDDFSILQEAMAVDNGPWRIVNSPQKLIHPGHFLVGEQEVPLEGLALIRRQGPDQGMTDGLIALFDLEKADSVAVGYQEAVEDTSTENAVVLLADDRRHHLMRAAADPRHWNQKISLEDARVMELTEAGRKEVLAILSAMNEKGYLASHYQSARFRYRFMLVSGSGSFKKAQEEYLKLKSDDPKAAAHDPRRYLLVEIRSLYETGIELPRRTAYFSGILPERVINRVLAATPGAHFGPAGAGEIEVRYHMEGHTDLLAFPKITEDTEDQFMQLLIQRILKSYGGTVTYDEPHSGDFSLSWNRIDTEEVFQELIGKHQNYEYKIDEIPALPIKRNME